MDLQSRKAILVLEVLGLYPGESWAALLLALGRCTLALPWLLRCQVPQLSSSYPRTYRVS